MQAGHGPNIGHGFVKYVIASDDGEREIVSPALLAPASRAVSGALLKVQTVEIEGKHYWTGDEALLYTSPLTILGAERLTDPAFIPALVAGAINRFGYLNGSASGVCVSGLPATWASNREQAAALGARLRAGHHGYSSIRIIPEPLGLIYASLLDTNGQIAGDSALQAGTIGVIDIGHHTVDVAIVKKLTPIASSLETWQLGSARALREVRAQLTALTERDLSLYEVDQATRTHGLPVAGELLKLPEGWDMPLVELAHQIVARLQEAWGKGAHLDCILIGGGGAEVEQLVSAICKRFKHAQTVERPQTAIARGYARLARRYAAQEQR